MKKFIFVLALILIPSFSFAQTSIVAEAKRELNLTSNLNPQQIHVLLRLVATKVRGGLLPKTTGNNCNGYSCDIVCFVNGDAFDVLSDSEGAANPAWSFIGKVSTCELVTVEQPKPEEPKEPEPKEDDIRVLLVEIISRLDMIQTNQKNQNDTLIRVIQELKAEIAKGIKVKF